MKGTRRLAEAEDVPKSDEGKRDSWGNAWSKERDAERKGETECKVILSHF